ncbi:MAG: aspartate kinase [Clostridia bacterium]|nr:aspartate kinase [Clostridia bacterium]
MGIIVQKFGGSSVANAEKIYNVAGRIQDAYDAGNSVVVVVSAQGDTTDDLIDKAAEINEKPSKREMDVLLSTGEQITIALLAMALEKNKYPVVSLTGWQTPIKTNMVYGSARIEKVETTRLVNELDKGRIVIVAGFQGVNAVNDITTLGRGGSDTTAVALAAALRADVCEIYTDVDGVYTCDPRIVPDAKKLKDISYDEMLELASLGANVLHNRSVEMAKKYHVDLEVKSSFQKVAGTKVKEAGSVEKLLVRGVARDNDVARIAVLGIDDTPGKAYRMFALLAKKNINVDVILQSIGRDNTKDISFTVSRSQMEEAVKILNDNLEDIGAKEVTHDEKISKVSIVGSGMLSNPGVAARMFEALYDANINIRMISTSEIKVSVLIDEDMAEKAVQAIHHKFFKD